LLIAGVATMWGSVGAVVREVKLPAVAIVSGRIWLATPALALFLRATGLGTGWQWRPSRRLFANGVVLAAHWVCFIAALQRAPIGTVLLITYLAPIGIAALAPAVLGEAVPTRTKVALGTAVAGIVLIAAPAMNGASADGIALAFLTGLLYVPLALLNKALSDSHGGVHLAMWQLLIAGVVLAPFAALADWGTPTSSWAWLIVLAVAYTAFAFAAYLTALQHLPATRAAVLLYLEPASAVVFGWVLLSEEPTVSMLIGGTLVVAAGLLVVRAPAAPEVPPVTTEVADVAG
jgi:drug/metabolite transporter (DMT)-like permease